MRKGEHSRTAEFMAFFRALETARGAESRLFDDPLARRFLRLRFRLVAGLARLPFARELLCRFIDWRWPGARSSGVARTRYIDEAILGALSEGIGQIVLLGAGFDCRAYRIPRLATVRVFEVDHADTARAKRAQLQAALGAVPPHVTFVATDFNRENLGETLHSAGFDPSRRTFFLWEGVTQYLDAEAVNATLGWVATTAPGSEILFTYVDKQILQPGARSVGIAAVNRALKDAAEPWVFGFDPAELPRYLEKRGLKLVCDLGAAEYRALYMKRRFSGYEFYRAASARVVGRAIANSRREASATRKMSQDA